MVVFDSLRYDSAMAAGMPNMGRISSIQQRWSYASWTAPSHYNLLMGLLPHSDPQLVYASEYYKDDFLRYRERLGVPGIEFKSLLPSIYLPEFLMDRLGYQTSAHVSMPVLNRHTPLNRCFDHYELMPRHNDMDLIIERMRFDGDRPWFHLLNIGETHYPYALPGEDPDEWPRISGVHGVIKRLDEREGGETLSSEAGTFFDELQLDRLKQRQVAAASYVDKRLEKLYDVLPQNTWVIITADHGDLFGEDGHFGHGPVIHPKVFEVPYAEGRIR